MISNPHFRNVVTLGCLVQFFQIMTGINAMVSFGGTLFETLGVAGLGSALVPSLAFFSGNAIGSFGLVDRAGRRCPTARRPMRRTVCPWADASQVPPRAAPTPHFLRILHWAHV